MRVDFYQLERGGPETVLPRLAERAIADGGRMLVVAADAELLDRLDEALWTWKAESFLPHGRAGDAGEAQQPILLAAAVEPANGARLAVLADGLWRDEALAFDRVLLLFGDDAVTAAREAWRALGRGEADRHYWRQREGGGWEEMG